MECRSLVKGQDNQISFIKYLALGIRVAITSGLGANVCAKAREWYYDTVSAIVVLEDSTESE